MKYEVEINNIVQIVELSPIEESAILSGIWTRAHGGPRKAGEERARALWDNLHTLAGALFNGQVRKLDGKQDPNTADKATALENCADMLQEAHLAAVAYEYPDVDSDKAFNKHKKDEPSCTYCAAIKAARAACKLK